MKREHASVLFPAVSADHLCKYTCAGARDRQRVRTRVCMLACLRTRMHPRVHASVCLCVCGWGGDGDGDGDGDGEGGDARVCVPVCACACVCMCACLCVCVRACVRVWFGGFVLCVSARARLASSSEPAPCLVFPTQLAATAKRSQASETDSTASPTLPT